MSESRLDIGNIGGKSKCQNCGTRYEVERSISTSEKKSRAYSCVICNNIFYIENSYFDYRWIKIKE